MKLAIIGGGSWGTALAHIWSLKGHESIILSRREEFIDEMNEKHTNTRYLPGLILHQKLTATIDPESALKDANVAILAIPTQHMANTLKNLAPYIPANLIPVCASKGIETKNQYLMHEIVAQEWPEQSSHFTVISGPSFAMDVASGRPAAVVVASQNKGLSVSLRDLFSTKNFRTYSSTDVIGVECAGAIKTVMALAAGISDGLAFGESARAGLITRGLAEMARFGISLGGNASTFMGLAGMGDLMVSCTAAMSRNRRVGISLAQGNSLEKALSSVDQVAEGFKTVEAVHFIAKKKNIQMPITDAVFSIINNPLKSHIIATGLLQRELKNEFIF